MTLIRHSVTSQGVRGVRSHKSAKSKGKKPEEAGRSFARSQQSQAKSFARAKQIQRIASSEIDREREREKRSKVLERGLEAFGHRRRTQAGLS